MSQSNSCDEPTFVRNAGSKPIRPSWDREIRLARPDARRRGPRLLRGSEWDIPAVLVDILNTGLRRIKALGQDRHPERCAVEAEHLQSLPTLLVEFDPEVLDRYWNVERPAFVQRSTHENIADFEPLWTALGTIIQTRIDEIERRG